MSVFRWLTSPQATTVRRRIGLAACTALLLPLAGCPEFFISTANAKTDIAGSISGLAADGMVLAVTIGDDVTATNREDRATLEIKAGATSFDFGEVVDPGEWIDVRVKTQPAGETCSVKGGWGAAPSGHIDNLTVTCVPSARTIGGTVGTLTAAGLVLQNNGADDLAVAANATTFSFATQVADGKPYDVTILSQPAGQVCQVSGGSGTAGASMGAIQVNCGSNSQTISTVGYTPWVVPAGVTAIQVVATGGGGAGTYGGSNGGSGAVVTSMLSVQPGDTVSVYVGGGGSVGYQCSRGGGMSYVGATGVLASNFIIAGGGGSGAYNGGNGGNAGSAGTAGSFGGAGGAGSKGTGGAAGTGSGVVVNPAAAGGNFSDIATAGSGSGGNGGDLGTPSGLGGSGISAAIGNGGTVGTSSTCGGAGGGGYGGGGGGGDAALNAFAGGGGGGGGGGSVGPAGQTSIGVASSGAGLGGTGGTAGAAGSVTIIWP